jgi:hypothetical protein
MTLFFGEVRGLEYVRMVLVLLVRDSTKIHIYI